MGNITNEADVIAGDAVVFQITTVLNPGWSNLDVVMNGVTGKLKSKIYTNIRFNYNLCFD